VLAVLDGEPVDCPKDLWSADTLACAALFGFVSVAADKMAIGDDAAAVGMLIDRLEADVRSLEQVPDTTKRKRVAGAEGALYRLQHFVSILDQLSHCTPQRQARLLSVRVSIQIP